MIDSVRPASQEYKLRPQMSMVSCTQHLQHDWQCTTRITGIQAPPTDEHGQLHAAPTKPSIF